MYDEQMTRVLLVHGGARTATPPQQTFRESDYAVKDPIVQRVLALINAAVRLNLPILIQGETGTGKEMLARYAHEVSGRRGEFVAINCAAIPDELFETELFGYAAGAFTGSRKDGFEGLIASADGGTLLLDEICELPLMLQAALLRFLDDRRVRPVGGRNTRIVDVQILAATNTDLSSEVAAKRFRADLFYRLDGVKAVLPPLRARSDFATAVLLVLASIDPVATIFEEAIARLAMHDWPGNFRELRTVLTHALLAGAGNKIHMQDVTTLLPLPSRTSSNEASSVLREKATEEVIREFRRTGGNVSRTARNLSISRNTVYQYLREVAKCSTSL